MENDIKMERRFEEEGDFESPFVAFHYRKVLSVLFAVALPIAIMVFLYKCVCKKNSRFSRVVRYFKESLVYNGILRTLIEVYIELMLSFCLNTRNLLFVNKSVIILSVFAGIFGLIIILVPFLSHSAIADNYRRLGYKNYHKKYGVLIEEFRY